MFLYIIYKTLLAVIKALKSYSMLHKNSLPIIRNLYKILTVPKQNNWLFIYSKAHTKAIFKITVAR